MGLAGRRVGGEDFSLHGPKFTAIAEQNLNEIVLLLNGGVLLDDKQGHESVGSQEDHYE